MVLLPCRCMLLGLVWNRLNSVAGKLLPSLRRAAFLRGRTGPAERQQASVEHCKQEHDQALADSSPVCSSVPLSRSAECLNSTAGICRRRFARLAGSSARAGVVASTGAWAW